MDNFLTAGDSRAPWDHTCRTSPTLRNYYGRRCNQPGFAAGLVLYWSVNNILSIAQQWFIQRKILAKNV